MKRRPIYLFMILRLNSDFFLMSISQLIFVMVIVGVFFMVRNECISIITTIFDLKGLNLSCV